MYSEITSNKRQTVFLIVIFSVIILGLGYVFGMQTGDPGFGILIATVVATVMNLFSYYQGDTIALKSSGARLIEKRDSPEYFSLVENLCIASGVPMPKLYIIEDSSPNAFATGRDPEHASIAVTTGLLQQLEKAELEGVLAHELSHIKNYDIRVMMIVVVLVGIIALLADWTLRVVFGRHSDRAEGRAGAILMIVGLVLAILSPLIAELIKLAISRRREYLADASGSLITRHPEGLARALEKIATIDRPLQRKSHATAHLFLANPFDPHVASKFQQLFSTHPPIEDRIKRLRSMGV